MYDLRYESRNPGLLLEYVEDNLTLRDYQYSRVESDCNSETCSLLSNAAMAALKKIHDFGVVQEDMSDTKIMVKVTTVDNLFAWSVPWKLFS